MIRAPYMRPEFGIGVTKITPPDSEEPGEQEPDNG
jgi:hypothetical protein